MLRLNHLAVIIDIIKQRIVLDIEDKPRKRIESGENVTGRSGVFTTVQTRTELTDRLEEIEIVTTDKILRQVNYSAHKGLLAVVIGRQLGHGTSQLRHFDLLVQVTFKTGE